ncbi:MAG: hypothetical protein PUG54_12115 [Firmicutes bacterium]|nr:hypothetical protein [Bacillota bacterium]
MNGENIRLNGAGFNKWLDEMEQNLTATIDLLDIMETEKEQLKEAWESGAGKRWVAEFQVRADVMRRLIENLRKRITKMEEAARTLSDLENRLIAAVERL